MENYNTTDLSKNELLAINGGDFWDATFTVFKTVFKYSSLTGALIVGVGDGVLEAIEEASAE